MVDSIIDRSPAVPIVQRVAVDPVSGGRGNVRQTIRPNPRPVAGAEVTYGGVPDVPMELIEPEGEVGGILLSYAVGQEPPLPPGSVMPIGSRRRMATRPSTRP